MSRHTIDLAKPAALTLAKKLGLSLQVEINLRDPKVACAVREVGFRPHERPSTIVWLVQEDLGLTISRDTAKSWRRAKDREAGS